MTKKPVDATETAMLLGDDNLDVDRAIPPWQEPEWDKGEPPLSGLAQSADVRRLMTALAHAQGEITNAKKSRDNPHFKSKYADLAEIADAARIPLSRHQIAVVQIPRLTGDAEFRLDTTFTHGPSGQYITGQWPLDPKLRSNQQGLIAQITYARRASIGAMAFIVAEDDDFDDDGNMVREAGGEVPSQDRAGAPARKSAAIREAEEWGGWAVSKVRRFDDPDALVEWREKFRPSISNLERLAPELHAQLIKTYDERLDELTPPQPDAGPNA